MENQFILSFLCALVLIILKDPHVAAIHCGETDFLRPLIINGTRTRRGEWPFLVALSLIKNSEFFCGGTLITEKHVLTAAHCINHKSSSVRRLPVDVVVHIGAYNLKLSNESNALKRYVSEFHVHPDWKQDSKEYDADIAILSLNESVPFTNYIRPMCMPAGNGTTIVEDIKGSVVGWGSTENGTDPNLEFIKHSVVTTLNDSYCYTTDYNVARSSSVRTFCGRGQDGSPYKGDSGGGLYVRFASTWVQYGIVSNLNQDARRLVEENSVAVYTNVKHFKNWIMETVNQSAGRVGEAEYNLHCHYSQRNPPNIYAMVNRIFMSSCDVIDLNIRSDNLVVTSFSGSMRDGETAENVEQIILENGTMFYLPAGIGTIFKNLKGMYIYYGLGLKSISRSNLQNLENLKDLRIDGNEIETLNEDTLWDLPNLEEFSINHNNVKEIPGRTFEKNVKLNNVDLGSNSLTTIDETMFETNTRLTIVRLTSNKLENLPKNLFKNNLLLEWVNLQNNSLKTIDEMFFHSNVNLEMVALPENQLEVLPKNLFQNNLLLVEVELWDNSLKIIEVDFTRFPKLTVIGINNNVCINAYYYQIGPIYPSQITNLTEFQNLIRTNCSSQVS